MKMDNWVTKLHIYSERERVSRGIPSNVLSEKIDVPDEKYIYHLIKL